MPSPTPSPAPHSQLASRSAAALARDPRPSSSIRVHPWQYVAAFSGSRLSASRAPRPSTLVISLIIFQPIFDPKNARVTCAYFEQNKEAHKKLAANNYRDDNKLVIAETPHPYFVAVRTPDTGSRTPQSSYVGPFTPGLQLVTSGTPMLLSYWRQRALPKFATRSSYSASIQSRCWRAAPGGSLGLNPAAELPYYQAIPSLCTLSVTRPIEVSEGNSTGFQIAELRNRGIWNRKLPHRHATNDRLGHR